MIASAMTAWPRPARYLMALTLPMLLVLGLIGVATTIESAARAQSAWRAAAGTTLAEGAAAQRVLAEVAAGLKSLPSEGVWARLYAEKSSEANQAALVADISRALALGEATEPTVIPQPTREAQGLQVWSVQASFGANAAQLYAVGEQLRALPRYVRVMGIAIDAPPMQSPADNTTFSVELTLEGFGVLRAAETQAEKPQ